MKHIISIKTLGRKLKKAALKQEVVVWADAKVIEYMRENWMEDMIGDGAKISFKLEIVPIRLNYLGLVEPMTPDKKPASSWLNAPFELVRTYQGVDYKGYVIKRPVKVELTQTPELNEGR